MAVVVQGSDNSSSQEQEEGRLTIRRTRADYPSERGNRTIVRLVAAAVPNRWRRRHHHLVQDRAVKVINHSSSSRICTRPSSIWRWCVLLPLSSRVCVTKEVLTRATRSLLSPEKTTGTPPPTTRQLDLANDGLGSGLGLDMTSTGEGEFHGLGLR